jgi:predicted RNA-binding protein YlxR (DUF448 family)
LRTCVGCRRVCDRRELVRLGVDPGEGLVVDPVRIAGRGAYLCPSLGCLEKARQRKVFPRAFRRGGLRVDETILRRRFAAELKRRGIPVA